MHLVEHRGRVEEAGAGEPLAARAHARAAVDRVGDEFVDVNAGEFYERIRTLARGLIGCGVKRGDRVALMSHTRLEWLLVDYAILAAGGVTVPVYETSSAEQLQWILEDSEAVAVVLETMQMAVLHDAVARDTPQCRRRFVIDQGGLWELADRGAIVSDTALDQRIAELTTDRLATIVYTSGTTGRPKGVMHTHINDVAIAMNCVMEYGLRPKDVALHIAPLYHVGGMQAFFIPHMMVGGTNVVLGHYTAQKTLEIIEAEGVTTLFAVPTQIQEMLLHPELVKHDVRSLRMITTGGAAIAAATMERVIRELCPNIFNGYGMTEASLTLLLHPEQALSHLGSCGKPTLITTARVIEIRSGDDASPNDIVQPGSIGQLIVRGPQVMDGYWNNPAETAKKLRSGWLYTGDLVSQNDDGFFYFRGRVDDMIVSGGENIYPREVEEILYRCPGVQDAAVVGLPDEKWGSAVTAFIVANAPGLDAAAIDTFCRTSPDLASYKRPRRILFIDHLPTNPSGKVLKRELVARYGEATVHPARLTGSG